MSLPAPNVVNELCGSEQDEYVLQKKRRKNNVPSWISFPFNAQVRFTRSSPAEICPQHSPISSVDPNTARRMEGRTEQAKEAQVHSKLILKHIMDRRILLVLSLAADMLEV